MEGLEQNAEVSQPQHQQAVTPSPVADKHSAEYKARMASMAPANVPDKFKNSDGTVNVAALTEAYRQLEVKQSQGNQPPAQQPQQPQQTQEQPAEQSAQGGESLEEMLQPKPQGPSGWDLANQELARDGKISDATKAQLKEKFGANDAVISNLEAGYKAQQQVVTANLAQAVGGTDKLKAVLQYAASKLDAEGIKSLRQSLSGSMGPMILKGLAAEMVAASPAQPQRQTAPAEPRSMLDMGVGGAPSGGVQPYKSAAEMLADIRSPKYAQDPDFRMQVAKRIHAGSR